jgi:hypothetical protein
MNEIIKNNGISFGIATGIFSSLTTATLYAVDLNLFAAWWVVPISMVIYITIGSVLLAKTKKALKGVFPFKEAFTTYFIYSVIGIIISVLFSIVLFNFIDPSAKETLKEIQIKSFVEMMGKFGTPAAAINEAVAKMQQVDQWSIVEQLKGSVFSVLFSTILGLILALIFRSKPSPE